MTAYAEAGSMAGTVGYMPMPLSFAHRSLFLHGRPKHQKFDDFWWKHPPMDIKHRAKIFAPFDALTGFDDAIDSKTVPYEKKRILSDEEKTDLDRKLASLASLTYNSRAARANAMTAVVTYFVPCRDAESEWFGRGGRYEEIRGIVMKVDPDVSSMLLIDEKAIAFDDIAEIRIETQPGGEL